MNTESYWLDSAALPRFAKLERDLDVDVIVVGAGMTGITAAYLLKRAGKRVALVERERCVSGDTAATTAHLTCVTDTRLPELVRTFGRDHAAAVWDAGAAAVDMIEENVAREKIACDFQRVPGYLHASLKAGAKDESHELREEAKLAVDLGFEAAFVEHTPVFNRPGMRIANQAIFHPVAYLRRLLEAIPGDGSDVFEFSEAGEFSEKPLSVKVNGHTVTGKYVVIATHVPLMGNNGLVSATLFQSKLAPYSSYVVGGRAPKRQVPAACFWDTSDPYYYLRIDPHRDFDYVIFGGEDHKTGQASDTDSIHDKLEAMLAAYVPGVKVDHRWSGQVIETNDGLPLIGELGEKQFVSTGYAGNGMTFGTLGGMMACDAVLQRKNPWAELFDVHRKKVFGGTLDYIKENIDYPYYLIKDRLAGAQGKDAKGVGRGEGKILMLDGKRVAASRDDKGKLTVVSAICTHMGCVVHWNNAEKTWDCPCHGSRFKCNGDVLAGPAEEPLAPANAKPDNSRDYTEVRK